MTVRQEAIDLISKLPEENIKAVITIMNFMLKPYETAANNENNKISDKMSAFMKMQNLRKITSRYYKKNFDFDTVNVNDFEGVSNVKAVTPAELLAKF